MSISDFRPYSIRTGKRTGMFDLDSFKEAFMGIFNEFNSKSYFNEYFGFNCVDQGYLPGKIGIDVNNYFLRKLKKRNMWPLAENISNFTEDDLFDVIELLFHNISKPEEDGANYHSYNDCGWHYEKYNKGLGWYEYQQEINTILRDYGDGYEINKNGEIIMHGELGLNSILNAEVPQYKDTDIHKVIEKSINKFRSRTSSDEDRKEVVRNLADCFEQIRNDLKKVISNKDEDDIFNIANNFAIRHKNDKQKNNYDKGIWLSWMFYFYLSTLHSSIRLLNKYQTK